MEYMYLAIGTVIILSCFFLVISPFFMGNEAIASPGMKGEDVIPLEEVYRMVNDLEMDFLMKKVSQQDYESLKNHYQLLAASLMNNPSVPSTQGKVTKQVKPQVDEEIMRELAKVRENGRKKG